MYLLVRACNAPRILGWMAFLAAAIWAADARADFRFDPDQLLRFKRDLFEGYPPTRCVVSSLLGQEVLKIARDGTLEQEGSCPLKSLEVESSRSDVASDGSVAFARCAQNSRSFVLIWIHPDWRTAVVKHKEGQALDIWTNDKTMAKAAPALIEEVIVAGKAGALGSPERKTTAPLSPNWRGGWTYTKNWPKGCEGSAIEHRTRRYVGAVD